NWQAQALAAGRFALASYVPRTINPSERLTVYIEGDGLAWINASQVSLDPTPLNPVGLKLALRHQSGNAAYLARPCQYARAGDNCRIAYWTSRRFSEEVIASANLAIDQLKKQFGAKEMELVGYSGGGAVAALVAARRHDVIRLVTVAGNLDHQAWTALHRISPLTQSLNPADAWRLLQTIPQKHFVGAKDDNITPAVIQAYRDRFPATAPISSEVVPAQTHECCWEQVWPVLQVP